MSWHVRVAAALRLLLCMSITLMTTMAGGCANLQLPANKPQPLFDQEKMASLDNREVFASRHHGALVASHGVCAPAGSPAFMMPGDDSHRRTPLARERTMRFSPGDRFNLLVPGSPEFSGDYVVNADGRVILPFAGEVEAVGLSNIELSKRIEAALIKSGAFKPEKFLISVRPMLYAPINVTVSGAVFLTGRYVINSGAEKADKGDKALSRYGDSPIDRFVAAALRNAGGVRPDADLSQIILKRGKQTFVLNWQGALTGAPVDDVPLLEGDHIHVTEAPCFQSALVRPSQITPPGIRVFMSNLSAPAFTANASNITKESSSLPYGTRLLAGLVSANCVGGSRASNASRYAVLISRNPKTMETEVIQRSIEDMVLSPDRDTVNPFLMPDDAIACYDSAVSDVREIAATIQSLVLPGQTLRNAR